MKILWVVNIELPEASLMLKEKVSPWGGWLVNTSTNLAAQDEIDLFIAYPKAGLKNVLNLKSNKIQFYAFPQILHSDQSAINNSSHLKTIVEDSNPDIVHVFGTEFAHSLAMVNLCRELNLKVIISIQGLLSVIYKHYLNGLPERVINRLTFRDFIKQDGLRQQQSKFKKNGLFEIKALQQVRHIIGRTTWDRACTFQINPEAMYHTCNESLRNVFYNQVWDLDRCEKHTIFVSQASYPVKGLHFLLEAMPLIKKQFPDTKLYVAGHDITRTETIKDKLKISSYSKYIKELINKNGLREDVIFTGLLDEKQMCGRFLKSHVFVSPSTIENSPNSLGEAMLLGVPCVASNVGGVPDLLRDKVDGFLYQPDAPYMLAYHVCQLFGNQDLALSISACARARAAITHSREINNNSLLDIYRVTYHEQK